MTRMSRFKVYGVLDGAGGARAGTVLIERAAGLLHVRPFRRRRVYTMPLSMVADMVCRRILMNEMYERRAAKAKRKKGSRR
jgi:hypothetical protein